MDRNFRFAFNGFNRSDVVNYLEFLNMKHSEQVNQLTMDNEMLRRQLNAQQDSDASLPPELEELYARLEAVKQERDALMCRVVTLENKLNSQPDAPVQTAPAALAPDAEFADDSYGPMQELETYRRAERAEREAKERAQKIHASAQEYVQLAIAKAQTAAETYEDAARRTDACLNALLTSADAGRQAMLTAVEQLRKINMD